MKNGLLFICFCFYITINTSAQNKTPVSTRAQWLAYLDKIARPVLTNLAANTLKEKMPLVLSERVDNKAVRSKVAFLEAFARTLSGIGPWLWENADTTVQHNVKEAFLITRNTVPVYSNWLLFTAMIETFFCRYNLPYDKVRIDFAVKEFSGHWYTGDGFFSDGMQFHLDYYNSYVIQPYLQCIVSVINKKDSTYKLFAPKLDKITKRYAVIQERMINTDGSFPVTGRSITYRGGAFHHLANMALLHQLPEELEPAQIRNALTAVLKKTLDAPETFNEKGWLNIGLYGSQPNLAEGYINTGSLYLCSQIFLPLGLPPTDDFWSKPDMPWTSVKIWSGQNVAADHALE